MNLLWTEQGNSSRRQPVVACPADDEPMATQAIAPPQPSALLICQAGAEDGADLELNLRVEPRGGAFLILR